MAADGLITLRSSYGPRLALSGMVGLLGAALFLYLSHAVLPFM
jgi:hypothetical protein